MIDIKAGDWVLVEHPYRYDSYVVREVKSVTKAMFVGLSLGNNSDGEREEARRSRSHVRGLFASREEAAAALPVIREQADALQQDIRKLREDFHARIRAMAKVRPS